MSPTLRIAGPADADTLSVLAAEIFTDTFGHLYPLSDLSAFLDRSYAPRVIETELKDPTQRWWIAEQDGRPVGYAQAGACALPHPDARKTHGELKRLYIRGDVQGTGLGVALFDTVLAWIAETFDGPVWIGVWSENERALKFYGRYGFERCGEYVFPVGETQDDEYILRRG